MSSESEEWQQHQKHDTEYVQSIIDKQVSEKAESARVRIKERLQRRMDKVQSYALEALQKIGITDIPDWTASVSGSGVCCGGSLPDELKECFGEGALLSELSDDTQRAMVSLDITALTRFVIGTDNPEPWAFFDVATVIAESSHALNDPARCAAYLERHWKQYCKQYCSDAGKTGDWRTKNLIDLINRIINRHPRIEDAEIYNRLDAECYQSNSFKVERNEDGTMTLYGIDNRKQNREKPIDKQYIITFIGNHRQKIKRRKPRLKT